MEPALVIITLGGIALWIRARSAARPQPIPVRTDRERVARPADEQDR